LHREILRFAQDDLLLQVRFLASLRNDMKMTCDTVSKRGNLTEPPKSPFIKGG
jgi:hypothetical protein